MLERRNNYDFIYNIGSIGNNTGAHRGGVGSRSADDLRRHHRMLLDDLWNCKVYTIPPEVRPKGLAKHLRALLFS
jgi:hypothetical protein